MKALPTRILLLFFLLLLLPLTACGGTDNGDDENLFPPPETQTYTVLVTDDEGTPLANVLVELHYQNRSTDPIYTDENGKISIKLDILPWKVRIPSPPDGYEGVSERLFPDGDTSMTIVLSRTESGGEGNEGGSQGGEGNEGGDVGGGEDDTTVTYTVTVTDEDGNPIPLAWVQFCIGEICMMPIATGDDGKMSTTLDKGEWKFKVAFAPEGYEASSDYTMTEDGVTEYTVVLTEVAPPEGGGEDEETPGGGLESSDDTEGDNFGDFTPFG